MRLVSSCPNIKSLGGPGSKVFSMMPHPAARPNHLSVTRDNRGVEGILSNILRSAATWDVAS